MLHEILPDGYTYIFKQVSLDSECSLACSMTVLTNASTEKRATDWIADFEGQTKTTYRITRGVKITGKKLIYKTMRHCQHKRKPSKKPLKKKPGTLQNKKTECPAHITMKVYNQHSSIIRNHTTHPCEINLVWRHNHAITCAKALTFRPISAATTKVMHTYFEQGHSPSSALHTYHLNLAIEHDNDAELDFTLADRSLNPMYSDIYYIFKKWRMKQHGEPNGEKMFEKLEEAIKEYNEKHKLQGGKAHIQRFERKTNIKSESWDDKPGDCTDTPLVLAVCTPLMTRAHEMLRQAGELIFCDSTASLDRHNCPTFIMSTSSSGGGIPLGVVITSGESEDVLAEAFSHLRSVMPDGAFYGRGDTGPQIFITDDAEAERNALRTTWPEATQLLCIFHYLQSWWRWLWDNVHGISMEDRQPIMHIVRSLVFNRNEVALEERYEELLKATSAESFTVKYPQFASRLETCWARKTEWALAYRAFAMTRGSNTNNVAEAGIRVLKEIVFGRVKAYNLIQMFHFITTTMEIYYSNRLLDIAHSRYRPGTLLRYRDLEKQQDHIASVKLVRDSIYMVHETKDGITLDYLVEIEIGICSCAIGLTGAACKHQAAVAKHFKLATVNVAPVHSKECRQLFAIIARGKENTQDIQFYADLIDSDHATTVSTNQGSEHATNGDTSINNGTMDCDLHAEEEESVEHKDDSWTNHIVNTYKGPLYDIVEDLTERLMEGDHNLISGVTKFIKQYKAMIKSLAPNSMLAYALHNFGKSDSKYEPKLILIFLGPHTFRPSHTLRQFVIM